VSDLKYHLSHFRREVEGDYIDDVTLTFSQGDPTKLSPHFPKMVPASVLPDGVTHALKAHFFGEPLATVWMLANVEADHLVSHGFMRLEILFSRLGAPAPASTALTGGMTLDFFQQVLTSAGFGPEPSRLDGRPE
jgi:hypothetical protein